MVVPKNAGWWIFPWENPSINGWELGVPPWIGNLHVGIPYSLDPSQVPSVAASGGRRRRPCAGGIWRDDRWMGHRWWVVSKKNIAFWRSKIGWSQTILPAVCCWENDYKSSTLRVPYFSKSEGVTNMKPAIGRFWFGVVTIDWATAN